MDVFEFYKNIIPRGGYAVDDMEARIETIYATGKITAEQRTELLSLCNNSAKDIDQIDVAAKLAELEERIAKLESSGVVTWKSGHQTKKGETVLYDILKEGKMRYCRYDGGRSYTALSPGKINGWVILASVGGDVTHTVGKDADGKIILIPVEK